MRQYVYCLQTSVIVRPTMPYLDMSAFLAQDLPVKIDDEMIVSAPPVTILNSQQLLAQTIPAR